MARCSHVVIGGSEDLTKMSTPCILALLAEEFFLSFLVGLVRYSHVRIRSQKLPRLGRWPPGAPLHRLLIAAGAEKTVLAARHC